MTDGQLSIEELADRAGLTRRAVRFYVQRGLLPPPLGLGRGRHYDRRHVDAIRRVQELQAAGHSLDAIGKILAGGDVPVATAEDVAPVSPPRRRAELSAELWTRLRLMPGIELHFDAAEHPTTEQLVKIRQAVRRILRADLAEPPDDGGDDEED